MIFGHTPYFLSFCALRKGPLTDGQQGTRHPAKNDDPAALGAAGKAAPAACAATARGHAVSGSG
jgi:hypothetical protein